MIEELREFLKSMMEIGWSLTELAEGSEVHISTLSRFLQGAGISADNADKLLAFQKSLRPVKEDC